MSDRGIHLGYVKCDAESAIKGILVTWTNLPPKGWVDGKGEPRKQAYEGKSLWVPRGALHHDSDVFGPGGEGELIVHGWWARTEGLEDQRP